MAGADVLVLQESFQKIWCFWGFQNECRLDSTKPLEQWWWWWMFDYHTALSIVCLYCSKPILYRLMCGDWSKRVCVVLCFPTMQVSMSSSPGFLFWSWLCFWFCGCRTISSRTSVSIGGSLSSRGWAFLIKWLAWTQKQGGGKDEWTGKNRQKDRQTGREDTNQSMLRIGQRLQDLIHDAIRQKWCHTQLHFTVSHRRKHNTHK